MAKLPQAVANRAASAEPSGGFQVLEPGIYQVKVVEAHLDVPTRDGAGRKASFRLEVDQDGAPKRKLFWDVSHAEAAAGLMAMTFNAFGLTFESDEDEFLGERALADLSVGQSTGGKYNGRPRNEIVSLMPLSGVVASGAGNKPPQPVEDPWS